MEFEDSGSDLHLARPLTCHMRKLRDDERPLEILLKAVEEAGMEALEMIHFVLQEYSSGEIIVSFCDFFIFLFGIILILIFFAVLYWSAY